MIFLSHTYLDKPLVDKIANNLANVFGNENVFYDSWSIQPGDGIIEKMNQGLEACSFFFFFVSNNSLKSKMVTLEWQNALYKSAKGTIKFIPVKLDDCVVPAILLQSLYIDLYNNGIEVAIRQMIDVINGTNTYKPLIQKFENIQGYVIKESESSYQIEFRAEFYLEPISRYCILIDNDIDNIKITSISDSVRMTGEQKNLNLSNGETHNALFESVSRGTTPQFPYVVHIETKNKDAIKLMGLLHATNASSYSSIPMYFLNI